jgi:Golgi SNAP receptor complex protein 2
MAIDGRGSRLSAEGATLSKILALQLHPHAYLEALSELQNLATWSARISPPLNTKLTNLSSQNTLFNTALKQSTSLKRDLSAPPGQPLTPSLLGQISASLTSFSRTLDSYSDLAKSELNPLKKEKAEERITSFRAELQSFREEFKELKLQSEEAQSSVNRQELLGRRPHNTATPDNPYSNAAISSGPAIHSPWAPKPQDSGSRSLSMGSGDYTRETHALREQNFFANTHTALDEYLARGQAVLGDLGQQREMLKGTQKRLYSVANTLGVSGDTIRMIERRAKQDKWIFWAGVLIFFLFCWLCLHYLR